MGVLTVNHLRTSFFTDAGEVRAVNDVSFNLDAGYTIGIVGESGSGKSISAYSIMQILASGGKIKGGSIKFENEELLEKPESFMRTIRGNKISIIFQDPMTSMNPTLTVGHQIMEAITLHSDYSKNDAKKRAKKMLELVGINEPEKRLKQYPFELSGGMRQRAMIAMALACEPDVLIADEPTTALDVTIQAQILELMQDLQRRFKMSIIMITHDLGVVAQMCDEVAVMYAGSICEKGTVEHIFYDPQHEYTKGLLRSLPSVNTEGELATIKGTPIDLLNMPKGCAFAPRCENAMKICMSHKPFSVKCGLNHQCSCWMAIKKWIEEGRLDDSDIPPEYIKVLEDDK